MSDKVMRRGPWVLAAIAGAALAAGAAARLRARQASGEADAPAEVGFMRALHAALRRDLSRLRDAATQIDSSAGAPATVLAGWDAFRAELDNHHQAEDDDLWPVLRRELSDPGELASVDAMVEEQAHRARARGRGRRPARRGRARGPRRAAVNRRPRSPGSRGA